jgi:hypothetical protein
MLINISVTEDMTAFENHEVFIGDRGAVVQAEWYSLDPGRIISFDGKQCFCYGSKTEYTNDGSVVKSVKLKRLTDKELGDLEEQRKAIQAQAEAQARSQRAGIIQATSIPKSLVTGA